MGEGCVRDAAAAARLLPAVLCCVPPASLRTVKDLSPRAAAQEPA
jgi:hypothetical protein